jgi:hypothetical protein
MPWLWQPNSQPGQPNGLGPPMLNYAAPPNPAAPTVGQGVAQTAADVSQALPSWPSVEEQRRMLQPLPGWQGTAVDAAKQWAEGVMMGTTAPGDVPPPGIVAYHGSPHSFDQFDTSKIGTGEGAQAYGHGLYFAEGEGVARSYRDALTAEKGLGHYWQDASGNKVDIEALSNSAEKGDPQGLAASMLRQSGSVDEAINDVTKYGPSAFIGGKPEMDATLAGLQDLKARGLERIKDTGHMYQVNIGAEPEHFLDWDKPLSEQHPVVQQAVKGSEGLHPNMSGDVTGQSIVDTLQNYHGNSAEAAQALQQAGIPGIRYLDQGSRAARDPIKLVQGKPYDPSDPTHIASHAMDMASGDRTAAAAIADRHAQLRAAEGDTAGADAMRQASTLLQSPRTIPPMTEGQPPGTHNYVVFSDDVISILKKYGLAGLMLGAGGAAAPYASGAPAQQ